MGIAGVPYQLEGFGEKKTCQDENWHRSILDTTEEAQSITSKKGATARVT